MITKEKLQEFWAWFQSVSNRFKTLYAQGELEAIAKELNRALDAMHPGIAWEMGAREDQGMVLTFSSEGNPSLRAPVDAIVASAPRLQGWEYHAYRQPRDPPGVIRLTERSLRFSSDGWRFSPSERPDAGRIDLVIVDDDLVSAERQAALRACFIYLDALLGEELVEKRLGTIQVTSRNEAPQKTYRMSDLPDYILWATNRRDNPLRP